MTTPAVETTSLTKRYDGFTAVDHLDLRLEEAEVFGFLGPNGSGKTTTILMLLGLTEPTEGQARVLGYDPLRQPLEIKRRAGYLPETLGFYEDMSARENLHFTARLNRLPDRNAHQRIDELLAEVGLAGVADKKAGHFSRGMRQRLGIADVLLKDPKLVFLDEPTLGLDPDGARQMLEIITSLNKDRGITIMLTSHLLHQVQQVCHRVGIMRHGKLVAIGTLAELRRQLSGQRLRIEMRVSPLTPPVLEALRRVPFVIKAEASDEAISVDCQQDVRAELARAVLDAGSLMTGMSLTDLALEDIYMRYFRQES